MADRVFRKHSGELVTIPEVSDTTVSRAFEEVVETVLKFGAARIKRGSEPDVIILSQEEFDALQPTAEPIDDVDPLDRLLAEMQGPEARMARQAAFDASPEELGEAALAEALRTRD